ncbi:MerR family transcriptional regulator [Speluncibacter jeojiensis]|uniref:MerR family transcriptional regulator n=1 Tax=Speluncibacter jeojiensis TaxID=2710754 RepID=A0A9X4RDP0_9ACTN|nr:MerR family transcriptional regulator [Corynebacteriales bacterium D3-21]
MPELHPIDEVAQAFRISVPALRYYEEQDLVRSSERRARVRQYDRDALRRLAYVQLWHDDGMLSLADSRAIVDSGTAEDRRRLIEEQRDAINARIRSLSRAVAVLEHMLGCTTDRALECPVTGGYIEARVDAALSGQDFADDFLPGGSAPTTRRPRVR